jgi:hypothetical protein
MGFCNLLQLDLGGAQLCCFDPLFDELASVPLDL